MIPGRELTEARIYIDSETSRESKDAEQLRAIALLYIGEVVRLRAIIAMPVRQTVNWRTAPE